MDILTTYPIYGQLIRCAESSTPFNQNQPQNESLLHAIWNQQLLHAPLTTINGSHVVIDHPGHWNSEAGPDFKDAVIRMVQPDGTEITLHGDVEIHRNPAEWFQHQHHNDPNYQNVILHAVWHHPGGKAPDLMTIEMAEQLSAPLPELLPAIHPQFYAATDRFPPDESAIPLADLSDEQLKTLLNRIAHFRLQEKINHFSREIARFGREQALYKQIAHAMGYKNNTVQFEQLAALCPISKLQTAHTANQQLALLMGTAGFLQDPTTQPVLPELKQGLLDLWQIWWQSTPEDLPKIPWKLNLRPNNHPFRRICALAALMTTCQASPAKFLTNYVKHAPTNFILHLDQWLVKVNGSLMDQTVDFTRKLHQNSSLLGTARRAAIIANILLPMLTILDPERDHYYRQQFLAMPRLADNALIKEGTCRFLIPPSRAGKVIRSNGAQQGLIQLINDLKKYGATRIRQLIYELLDAETD